MVNHFAITLHRRYIIDFTRQPITFLVIPSIFTVRILRFETRVVLKKGVGSNRDDNNSNSNSNDNSSNNDTENIMIITLIRSLTKMMLMVSMLTSMIKRTQPKRLLIYY